MVLREAHRLVAELIGKFYQLGQVSQHALVQVTPETGHALLDLSAAADAR
jgi:hypothetical protein